MSKVLEFKPKEPKTCDYCNAVEGEMIEGIGINKVVKNPLLNLGHWIEEICLDCLDCMREFPPDEE